VSLINLSKKKVKSFKENQNIRIYFVNLIKWLRKFIFWITFRLTLVFSAISLSIVIYFYNIIPPFENLLDGREKGSVTLLDRHGKVFAWRGEQFERSLRSNTASKYLTDAIISAEDRRFYNHFGVSLTGILGAIRINLREGRRPFQGHGGSTITQQVAKLLCLMQDGKSEANCRQASITRKILEIPFALALELKFTKPQILSLYMNRVYLGASSTGFEAAAQRYFGKSARDVNLSESAMLAALLTAPSRYAPTNNLSLAQNRAKLVINLMRKQNYISSDQAIIAISNPATLSKNAGQRIGAHFADWVMLDAPKVLTVATTEDIVIKTTFDPVIQNHVDRSVLNVFQTSVRAKSDAEIAVVIMSKKGDVVAMLGGRKNMNLQGYYNRAFQAFRQPGSAFKPFVYAAALEQGYSPNYLLNDTKNPPYHLKSLKYWPKNYDERYRGLIEMNYGLKHSVNTATVQLASIVGIKNVINIASGLGIASDLAPNLSLALGSSEVSLLNLTSAYAGILNLGRRVYPRGWLNLSLKGTDEILIGSKLQNSQNIISESSSKALIKMLVGVVNAGTGAKAQIDDWHIAGKTGTSQGARDAWFVGFTSEYVGGVWIGYDDNSPLKGVTGGNLPSEIWSKIMRKIHRSPPSRFTDLSSKEYKRLFGVEDKKSIVDNETTIKNKNLFKRVIEFFKINKN
jgi:penicillin-binding protein 1A